MKKFKERKTASVLLLFLFIGIWTMFLGKHAFAQTGPSEDGSITMEVTYGYQNIIKGNRYIPLQIQFQNSGEEFSGTLSVLSMEADYEIYSYQYPVSLPAQGTSSEVVHIPLASKNDQLYLELTDENGRLITRKRVKMNISKEYAELFIGVLSDNPEHLSYLDNVGIHYSLLKTRYIPMRASAFPEDSLEMDLLDLLLVNDFDVNRLSPAQQGALIDWVNKGGILLLGTGKNADKTLEILDADYMGLSYSDAVEQEITFGAEYGKSGPGDAGLVIPCVDLELKNGTVILSSDNLPLLTMIHQEQGKIVAAAFDFADIEEFCREQPSLLGKLLMGIYGQDALMNLANNQFGGNSSDYWNIQSMIQSGNTNKLPKVGWYTFVMAAYVLLIGPGLYLFLKKREMGQFYRSSIILTSICFTGVIYMMGGSTRLYSAFFSYATIHEASGTSAEDTTYINVRVPYNKAYEVQVSPDYTLLPLTRDAYVYSMEQVPKFTGTETPEVGITYAEDKTTISVMDAVAFTPKYFKMEKSSDSMGAYLDGEIVLFDGQVYGYVTNHYPFAVQNAAVILYGNVIQLGDMEPDETREISGEQPVVYPTARSYVAAQFLSGYDKYNKADINDKEYLAALERSNMLSFYMQKHFSRYTSEAVAVAFHEEEKHPEFLAEQEYECFGRTMLVSPLSMGEKWGNRMCRQALSRTPKITAGSYYEEGNTMYGPDPLIIEYFLGSDLEIDEVVFESLSDVFMDEEKYYYLSVFEGKWYFYNYNTGGYDLMEAEKTRFSRAELEQYLSPENSLTIKYVQQNDAEDNNWEKILPLIYAIGGEKNAGN